MKVCHFCGRKLDLPSGVARTDSCPHCKSDLKCCRNCRFFDPGFNNQCREPQAEWTPDKEKANFCEFFELREAGAAAPAASKDDARSAFDALFKK
jgi:hypothetical protein